MKEPTTQEVLERRLARETERVRILEGIIEEKTRELFTEQQRLRSLNTNLNNVLETMLSALIVTDDQQRVERANQMAQRLLGWEMMDLLGLPLSQFLPLEAISSDEMAETGVLQKETFATARDGLKIPVLASVSMIWNEQSNTASLVCVLVDLRQRKELETQLLQTQKLESVGQLAAGIAHEINTPIQFIGDNLKFLEGAFQDLEPTLTTLSGVLATPAALATSPELRSNFAKSDYEYLKSEIPSALTQSLHGLERVAKIIQAMKEFSHPGREAKQAVDVRKLIESTLTISVNEWKYSTEIQTTFADDMPMIPVIPGALNQAMLNLIINSVHAIEDINKKLQRERGKIEVATRLHGKHALIQISDNGGGIPTDIQHRVFEPFFTTKDVGRGTGQGLAIARSIIVDKHGGELDFVSKEGEGTIFTIRLPL